MPDQPLPPFSCTYTPNLPELVQKLGCTLVISTFQAGKVIFISAKDEHSLVQLPRTFDRPMGIAVEDERMAIATKDEVILLKNEPGLATNYPKSPGKYDALYMPRLTYYTGQVDIHDLQWGDQTLWAVNTSFSCIASITSEFSWEPYWKPSFIDGLESEDRCHLNGMALQEGKPRYATALGSGNSMQSWRKTLPDGGILIDIATDQIISHNLSLPHSPRIIDDQLYMLQSGLGALVQIDVDSGRIEELKRIPGFVRGMAYYQDYLFIGFSRLRQNSSTFKDLEIASKATHAGISVLHLPTLSVVAQLRYETSVDEIYDIKVLPGKKRPGILNTSTDMHTLGLSIPQGTFWAQKAKQQ